MPTTLPPRVREHFGEQTAEAFSEWLEAFVHEHAVARDEYREVLSRLDVIDERFEQVDERSDPIEARFEARFNTMDDKLDRMNDRILSTTRWLIVLISLFGSLITALVAVAQFG